MLVQACTPPVLSFSPSTSVETLEVQTITPSPVRVEGVGNLRALAALENDTAWIGGTQGTIAKTEDAGKTWSLCSLPDGENLDVRALYLFDANMACAMCAGEASKGLSRIYRTVDAGKNWHCTFAPEKPGVFFNGLSFWDKDNGILLSDSVDDKFVLFSTKNGGETWEETAPKQIPPIVPGEVAFAASNSCLCVQGESHVWFGTGGGPFARIFYSSDKGKTWDVAQTPMSLTNQSSGIFSLAFLNEDIGIAVGGDYRSPTDFASCNIMITKDGGRNWEVVDDPKLKGKYLSCVVWKSENRVLVVDGSQGVFNAVIATEKGGWAVGPNQNCGKLDE